MDLELFSHQVTSPPNEDFVLEVEGADMLHQTQKDLMVEFFKDHCLLTGETVVAIFQKLSSTYKFDALCTEIRILDRKINPLLEGKDNKFLFLRANLQSPNILANLKKQIPKIAMQQVSVTEEETNKESALRLQNNQVIPQIAPNHLNQGNWDNKYGVCYYLR